MNNNPIMVITILCFVLSCSSDKKNAVKVTNNETLSVAVVNPQEMPIIDIEANLERIITFSRVATGVQFYYPGQGAYETDWDDFLIYGMYKVLLTNSDQEFVDTMIALFEKVAPDVKFNYENYTAPSFDNSDLVITWHQNGYKDRLYTEGSIYSPERRVLEYHDVLTNVTFTNESSFHMNYGDLTVDMPLILATKNETSVPLGNKFEFPDEWIRPSSFDNQYVCLASFGKVWNVINNYWPYFDAIDVDWQKELGPLLQSCNETDRSLSMKALRASLTKLEDNHISAWGTATAFSEQYSIPIGFEWVEGKVIAVAKAETASDKVSIGDELVLIDGKNALTVIEELAPYTFKSKAKRNIWSLLLYALRRDFGTQVTLTLETLTSERYSVTLNADTKLWDTFDLGFNAYVPEPAEQHKILEDNIHYVDLSISQEKDTEPTITALKGADAVVLDFRNYPESWFGWQNLLAHFSSNPISSAPMYYHWTGSPNRTYVYQQRLIQSIEPRLPQINVPIIVLASRYSQSSNEHALAFVQNAGLPIMGEPTSGINGNITYIYTAGVYAVFTALEVRQNDESAHIGVGIVPDIFVEQTRESFIKGEDHQLNEAVKYLKQQIQLNN